MVIENITHVRYEIWQETSDMLELDELWQYLSCLATLNKKVWKGKEHKVELKTSIFKLKKIIDVNSGLFGSVRQQL